MSKKDLLLRQIEVASDQTLEDLLKYLAFLHYRDSQENEESPLRFDLSKTGWALDWESAEEDEAWKDL